MNKHYFPVNRFTYPIVIFNILLLWQSIAYGNSLEDTSSSKSQFKPNKTSLSTVQSPLDSYNSTYGSRLVSPSEDVEVENVELKPACELSTSFSQIEQTSSQIEQTLSEEDEDVNQVLVQGFEFQFIQYRYDRSTNSYQCTILEESSIKEIETEDLLETIQEVVGFESLPYDFTFEQLLIIRSAITQLYIDEGYITTGAYIPEQEFNSDNRIITINIVEGRLATIDSHINSSPDENLIDEYDIEEFLEGILDREEALSLEDLEDSLTLLRSNPLIESVESTLEPYFRTINGANVNVPGNSRLTVRATPQSVGIDTIGLHNKLSVSLDNNRSPAVGSLQVGFNFRSSSLPPFSPRNSAVMESDFSFTRGSTSINASIIYPFDDFRTTAFFRLESTQSRVLEEPFDALQITSPNIGLTFGGQYRLHYTPDEELLAGIEVSWERSQTSVQTIGIPLTLGAENDGTSRIFALRPYIEWRRRSQWEAFSARLQGGIGLGIFSTVNDDAPDSEFSTLTGQLQWVARFAPDTLFSLRSSVQLSDNSLLALEQYALGGQNTVRGYRQDYVFGDNGILASIELLLPLWRRESEDDILLQLAPFFDIGHVWNYDDRPEPDPNFLASTGLGLRMQLSNTLQIRTDWGIPLVNADFRGSSLQENGIYFSIVWTPF